MVHYFGRPDQLALACNAARKRSGWESNVSPPRGLQGLWLLDIASRIVSKVNIPKQWRLFPGKDRRISQKRRGTEFNNVPEIF